MFHNTKKNKVATILLPVLSFVSVSFSESLTGTAEAKTIFVDKKKCS
jgi:hypothetical protein